MKSWLYQLQYAISRTYKGCLYVLQMVISAATHNSQHHITLRQWCYSNIHTGSCIYNASGRTGVIFDVSWCKHPQSKRAPKSWNNIMLRLWHGNACRITGHLWGESAGHRWIPLTKDQWCESLCCTNSTTLFVHYNGFMISTYPKALGHPYDCPSASEHW